MGKSAFIALAFLVAGMASASALADEAIREQWRGLSRAADLTVYADRSATLDRGCGTVKIAAGQWNTDGKAMSAMKVPPSHSSAKPRPAQAVARVVSHGAPEIQLQITESSEVESILLEPGKSQPFAHCL